MVMTFAIFGAGTAGAQEDADDPAQVEAGMAVYESSCAGCHGADGEGSERGRPLLDVAAEASRSVHVDSVTNGKGGMPAFGEGLSEEEIGQAISYVRLTFVSEETEALQELPRTGATLWITTVGVSLVAAGLAVLLVSRRRFETADTTG